MKRVLFLASVASMIDQFNMGNIRLLKDLGYEIHVVANFEVGNTCSKERLEEFKKELDSLGIFHYHISFSRKISNMHMHLKTYKVVKELVLKNKYKFIHCHSPIGGVIGRLVGRNTKTKVIYTAHGFHFFKGAPIKNWILFYPMEHWLSRYTDTLVTINNEDYQLAKKRFKMSKIKYISGIGIDVEKINNIEVNKVKKNKELGIPENAFVIISVGELNRNKNHEVILRAIKNLCNNNIHYIVCGQGPLKEYLLNLSIKLGIEKQVHLLGFRKDVLEILKCSDIFAFPSKREGLGLAAIEAMATGLATVTSNVHGILDYSKNNETGYCCNPTNINEFSKAIEMLYSEDRRITFGKRNQELAKKYDIKNIEALMIKIYQEL